MNSSQNSSMCCKGLYEYSSDEELADEPVFDSYPVELLQFSAACCFIVMALAIPGNIFTIIALSRYREARNATAIFIINLSVSDLLFACICLPSSITLFLNKSWVLGKAMCLIFPLMNYVSNAASVFSVVAITVNRYVMVAHPVHYPRMYQTKNLIMMIIAIWVGALSMLIPTLTGVWGRFSLDTKEGFCTIVPDVNNRSPKQLIVIMGFAFPSLFIVACYSRIMYIVRKSTAKCTSRPTNSNPKSETTTRNQEISTGETTPSGSTQEDEICDDVEKTSSMLTHFKNNFNVAFRRRPRRLSTAPTKRDKRLQTMIMAVMISFFACHLPLMIVMIVKTVKIKFTSLDCYMNIIGYILLYMTVGINPIIYVVMSKEYRQAYKSVFGFLWKR